MSMFCYDSNKASQSWWKHGI